MNIVESRISGVYLLTTSVLEDDRGFFLEAYKSSALSAVLGRPHRFAQTNHSRSQARVLRGFRKEPWDKLIYISRGRALCVVADPRPESETFGQTEMFDLGDAPGARHRLFVPNGVCNAFYCFTETDYINDVSEEFNPHTRWGIAWNDPTFAVAWPDASPILSPSDQSLPTLQSLFPSHELFQS